MPTARRNWTREETLVAFNLYCRTPFGRLHNRNPEIIAVAAALGRTPDALAMKCCNLAAFDETLQARGISGLKSTSRIDQQVWDEFTADPESIAFEAEQTYAAALNQEPRTTDEIEWEDVQGLDRTALTKVRVNQSFFRSLILTGYQSQCAVCGLPIAQLLVAAHIIPWSVDQSQRMNPRNGLCLCMLHDKAFDTGLLWIAADYKIQVAEQLLSANNHPAVTSSFTTYNDHPLTLPTRWPPDQELLQRHHELILAR